MKGSGDFFFNKSMLILLSSYFIIMENMSKYSRIVRNPEICGGQPTIRGTRVLVLDILEWIKEGGSFATVLENFPSISKEDIQRVLQASRAINLSPNKEIFDVLPREFIVDGERGVNEPLGLQGVRLETEVLVLAGFAPYKNNLTQTVLDSDLQILDVIPSPLASSFAVLSPRRLTILLTRYGISKKRIFHPVIISG